MLEIILEWGLLDLLNSAGTVGHIYCPCELATIPPANLDIALGSTPNIPTPHSNERWNTVACVTGSDCAAYSPYTVRRLLNTYSGDINHLNVCTLEDRLLGA